MIVKTDAIILRARKLRETSRFVTMYTASFGKLEVTAKGVRQPKSKLRGVLEPCGEISAVLYRKEHRASHYLSDAELLVTRKLLSNDFIRLSAAFAVVELVDAVMHDEEANATMYQVLRDTLRALDDASTDPDLVVLRFQLQLIHALGFAIQARMCAGCGNELDAAAERWFSPADGGFRCGGCGRGTSAGTKISGEAYTLLVWLENEDLQSSGPSVESSRARAELRGILNAYILHHTESRAVLRAGSMFARNAHG